MAVRRSVARVVGALVVPAICAATIAYFSYFTVWGERGLMALAATQAQLSGEQQQYNAIKTTRERLEYRIALLRHGDPDMVQEVWRKRVLGGENGVVMVPRDR
ncbi:MAG: septum formation initiator family protein [Alphaproteobacteria bacterium]|nr:septum formation initiator family protein [Alphaproteobacteria bacterium]